MNECLIKVRTLNFTNVGTNVWYTQHTEIAHLFERPRRGARRSPRVTHEHVLRTASAWWGLSRDVEFSRVRRLGSGRYQQLRGTYVRGDTLGTCATSWSQGNMLVINNVLFWRNVRKI